MEMKMMGPSAGPVPLCSYHARLMPAATTSNAAATNSHLARDHLEAVDRGGVGGLRCPARRRLIV